VGVDVDRQSLQKLTQRKREDAEALLSAGRWSAAYYHCGYIVEAALKACVLRYLSESGAVFGSRDYLALLAKCWTHDLRKLIEIAGLRDELNVEITRSPRFGAYWGLIASWNESSRYTEATEVDARSLFEAICSTTDGALPWLQRYW